MKSSDSIQLLDTQNNNISPITSIESLYIDASYIGNGDYVRYRVYDRIPFLSTGGSILHDVAESSEDLSRIIVDLSTEKTPTGPNNDDVSVYKLKYKYMNIDNFYGIIDYRIDDKLNTYLDVDDIECGDGIDVERSDSSIAISVKVDNETVSFNENGELIAPMSPAILGNRVTILEASVNSIESSIDILNASVNNNSASIGIINSSIQDINDSIITLNSSVNNLESSTLYMDKYIKFMFGGVTRGSSINSIPTTYQNVLITFTSGSPTQQKLTLDGSLLLGEVMNIRCENPSSTNKKFTLLLRDSSSDSSVFYQLMSPESQELAVNDVCEINVWCYDVINNNPYYSIKYINKES